MTIELPTSDRRGVIKAAGVVGVAVAVGGCSSYGAKQTESTVPPQAPVTVPADSAGGQAPANAIALVSDIPVGGGVVLAGEEVVVTQPTAGALLAFSAVCTHQGCLVNEVQDGLILCPCHGSSFNLDGTVAGGPAPSPLAARQITVENNGIVLA